MIQVCLYLCIIVDIMTVGYIFLMDDIDVAGDYHLYNNCENVMI